MSKTPKSLKDLYSDMLHAPKEKETLEVEKRDLKDIKLVFEMIQSAFDNAEDERTECRSVKSVFDDIGKLPAINAKLDSFANFNKQVKANESGIVSLFSYKFTADQSGLSVFIPEANFPILLSDFVGKKFFISSKGKKIGFIISKIGQDVQTTIEPAQIGLMPNKKPYIVNVNFPLFILSAQIKLEPFSADCLNFTEIMNSRIVASIPSAKTVSEFFYKAIERDSLIRKIESPTSSQDFLEYKKNKNLKFN